MSQGYTIGSNNTPTANLNVVSGTGTSNAGNWELRVQLNRDFASDATADRQYLFSILIPNRVGCNVDLVAAMTLDTTQPSILYQDIEGKWIEVTTGDDDLETKVNLTDGDVISNAHSITTQIPAVATYACFNKVGFELTISDAQASMCDVIVCFTGTFLLAGCQSLMGCDKFPLYVSADSENSNSNINDSLTTVAA